MSTDERSIRVRKRPIEVEAWQYDGADTLQKAPAWVREYLADAYGADNIKRRYRIKTELGWLDCTDWFLQIPTLEGWVHASKGDWIIKGVKGELYPCKPAIFEETYERLPSTRTAPP